MTDTPPTTTDEGCVKWTLTAGDVTVEVSASLNDAGDVVFTYELVSGAADLNGLYLDLLNDGGDIRKLDGGNNMTGSDSDGDKLDGFDWATVIGTVGGSDADTTSGSVTVSLADLGITSLTDLDGAEIGIRATSVGTDGEGSLKLANTGTYCEPEPPEDDLCDRPLDGESVDGKIEMQTAQTAQITLTFFDNAAHNNGLPTPGDVSGDGYYTVTITVPAEMAEDPDAYMDDIVALLLQEDPNMQDPALQDYFFKSAIITDCHGDSTFYQIETDQNGPIQDTELGTGQFNDADGIYDENTDVAGHIDASYDLQLDGDAFVFA